MKKNKGITLVALVVTVIILMILAGITLTIVLGQNGIIGKAKEAKEVSANDQKATEEGLNNLYNEMLSETKTKPTTISSAIGEEILSTTDNTALKDDNGNTVTIPAGFHIATGSPTKQEDGIVVEDKDGNQFVWIPVTNVSDYKRTAFLGENITSSYIETMPIDEQTSVNNYKGYYIGRYETGDKEATLNKAMRSTSIITHTLVIKKGQAPYNLVTIDQAKTLAGGMSTTQGYKAITKLCSSYAWDTTINFMQKKIANYSTNSPQGNYIDTSFNYTDITGASQTKKVGSSALIPTGQTTSVNNIYDMGGNDWEWTTEGSTLRGGEFDSNSVNNPAGSRMAYSGTFSGIGVGFRVTLFM